MKRLAALFLLIALCMPLAARAQNNAPAAQPTASAPTGSAPAQGRNAVEVGLLA